jgi:hypothetical protein
VESQAHQDVVQGCSPFVQHPCAIGFRIVMANQAGRLCAPMDAVFANWEPVWWLLMYGGC